MTNLLLIEAVQQALESALSRDERVILIGEDIGKLGGLFGATRGLLGRFGQTRVIDAPPGLGSMVGVSIGAALSGFRPVCEIPFADSIYPALNQVLNEAARIYFRSAGDWQVPLVLRVPYGGIAGGGLYHSQCVESLFTHTPGLKVVVPSNPYDAKGLLLTAIADPNPVVFLEPKRGYRLLKGDVPPIDYEVPLGHARISRRGYDLSLVAYGLMHEFALQAAQMAVAEGIEVEVIDLRTLCPLDLETILVSVNKTGKALIVHEDNLTGGFGAEIAALLAERAFQDLDAPVIRLGGPDVPAIPYSPDLFDWFMPGPDKILEAIRRLARY